MLRLKNFFTSVYRRAVKRLLQNGQEGKTTAYGRAIVEINDLRNEYDANMYLRRTSPKQLNQRQKRKLHRQQPHGR